MKVTLALVKALLDKSIPKVKDGVDGLDGSKGATGATGERGEVGKQGLSGNEGRDGLDGLNGADGSDGRDGLHGKVGKRGEKGLAGINGLHGSTGIKGKVGKQGLQGPKGDKGDTGKGITSIRVNEKNMLVVTYDDGDMTIAGTVSVTREGTSITPPTGAPVGSFGVVGTKVSEAGELIIVGAWGKEFNTGFTSGAGSLQSTFETVNKNLKAYGFVLNYTGTSLTSIIYTKGSSVITKTFGYTGELLTSITLSGDLPTGIQTVKTLQYTDSTLSKTVYS
jgi:hypothetical protein